MEDYRVQLDNYHGPLDLLLYLIKRNEVDLHNIPITPITEQYLAYMRRMEKLDINVAGEFVVMAATLMEIKSALLVPHEAAEGDDPTDGVEDPADPRYELVQQLLAYKRFKDAAYQLEERRDNFSARFARKPAKARGDDDTRVELDLEDVSLWDLVEAFGRMMDQVGLANTQHEVVSDDTPIELHAADIVDRLERDGSMSLQAMFAGRRRGEMVGLFSALLELTRQRRVRYEQDRRLGEITIHLRDPAEVEAEFAAEAEAEQRERPTPSLDNPDDFEWPSDEVKQRFIRRVERRARGEFIIEDEQFEQDVAAIEAQANTPAGEGEEDDQA